MIESAQRGLPTTRPASGTARAWRSSRWLPYVAALFAGVLALAAVGVIDAAQRARLQQERRAAVLSQLGAMRGRIESALTARLGAGHALAAYVMADTRLSPVDFTAFASSLILQQNGVRYLGLAQGTVVTNLYPATGNEALIGSDLLTRPELRDGAQRAIDGRRLVVAGPIPSRQGQTFVVLLPINVQVSTETSRFYGLAIVGIDQDLLLADAGLFVPTSGLRWALRGRDAAGPSGDVFAGDVTVLRDDPVQLDFLLPSGSWQLAAVPSGGWNADLPGTWVLRAAGLVTTLLFSGLIFFLVRQPTLLREAVNAATAALREREETLELRVQERTHELATLLHVSRTLASTLELEEVVDLVLDQLARVVEYVGARVWLVDGDEVILVGDRGPLRADARSSRASLRDRPLVNETYQSGAPIIVDDVRGDDNDRARAWRMREAAGALPPGLEYLRSWLGVPLVARDRVIGVISIGHDESAHFRPEHADIALAFATQAAIAIENARLYEEAQGRAALEERQRLARDLHDAVTQTLFSASLIAEVLPKIWQRDAIQGQARLDELRQLTRGALAEMRTLLLELRPTVLTETALPDLLRQLSEAFTGRARVPVDLRVEGEGSLPTDVQIALYRVAQESLHNVAKHAGATRVDVRLIHHPGGVQLSVEDDGRGFDPDAVPAGHLGVGIMRERAEAVGAAIEITSRPSAGTRVEVVWPAVADGADSDEHRAPYE